MRRSLAWCCLLALITLLGGCRITNPSVMIRTPKNYPFDVAPSERDSSYRIGVSDRLAIRMLTNDGEEHFKVMAYGVQSSGGISNQSGRIYETTVEYDGLVKLPILGRKNLLGMTKRQAEDSLEIWFSNYYSDPFVQISVTNRRVIVFAGSGNEANLVPFEREEMNLFEALAASGGISSDSKARKIKLIRGDLKDPEIYLIDLSTIDGMKNADLQLKSGDIIYVEPRENFFVVLLDNINPILGVVAAISNVFLIAFLIQNLQ
jgi:polysaccharide biosynthesis/export protein